MIKHKTLKTLILTACLLLVSSLAGCGNIGDYLTLRSDSENGVSESETPSGEETGTTSDTAILSEGSTTLLNLDEITEPEITLDTAGTYVLSGTYRGMLRIDTGDEDTVNLILKDAVLINNENAAIYVANAGKVLLKLESGTENSISHDGSYTSLDDHNIDGAVYSADDLTVTGDGSLTVTAKDGNGIVCNDDLVIDSGTLTVSAEKHGLEGKDSVDIKGGTILISESKEGIEGNIIHISGGNVDITAWDDGINASGDDAETPPELNISGGIVNICAKGDGLDSNGTITVSGGETFISGSENDGNAALDAETGATVTGGSFIALGSSGMAQNFGESSTQGSVMLTTKAVHEAGTEVTLRDEEGKLLLSYTSRGSFNNMVISCPALTTGSTFTVNAGDESFTVTLESLIYGQESGMRGSFGNPRGMQGNMPEGFDPSQSGERPEMPEGGFQGGRNGHKKPGEQTPGT